MKTQIVDIRTPIDLSTYQPSKKVSIYLAFVNNVANYVTDADAYKNIVHPEAVFFEYPNLVTKNGQVRTWTAAEGMKGIETGKQILSDQYYKFFDVTETGNKIVAEGMWLGTIKTDFGALKKGQQLKAYLCVIAEFKDEKLYRIRNYDCYEPFA
ncbi:MAG TPA: hypothetical protein VH396_21730 [Chitinophagaceae bacterium]|jgi:hypothetical protein